MRELPLIDLAPLTRGDRRSRQDTVARINAACLETGFMLVEGHGIPAAAIASLREAVIGLFDLPMDQKLSLAITRDNYRGYIPLGFFTANAAGRSPDNYEGYKLHCEIDRSDPIRRQCSLYGPNKWPEQVPGLRQVVLDYWQHCDRLADTLLGVFAEILGIDANMLLGAFTKPLTNMTLLHYPPQDQREDRIGIHPHKDTDALTILAPDPVGGLQIRAKGSDKWLSADAPDGALIINIGDLLEIWSGGLFVSTPHRVVNLGGRERYSFPYFAVPRFDVTVAPLCEPQRGFEYREVEVGADSRQIWASNWKDADAVDARIDPAVH